MGLGSLNKWWAKRKKNGKRALSNSKHNARRFVPRVEGLEERVVPAFVATLEQAGFAALVIQDQGPNDESPVVGEITYGGAPAFKSYGTFEVAFTYGLSKPNGNTPTNALMDLTFQVTTNAGGTLNITLGDTDFDAPPVSFNPLTLASNIHGNVRHLSGGPAPPGSSVTVQAFADVNNIHYGTGVTPGPHGPFSGPFSDFKSVTFNRGVGAYSLTSKATIVLGAGGLASADHAIAVTGQPGAAVGDRVWCDDNANGIQDAGEHGVGGVTVNLYKSDNTSVGTTTTNASGLYLFSGLTPGQPYYLEFLPPAGQAFTLKDQGSNDAVDSDADLATGRTVVFTLAPGEFDSTRDAGLICGGIDIIKYVKIVSAPTGGEGLTPGFWKTHSKYGPAPEKGWPQTGYDPDNKFNTVFGVTATGNPTLLQALGANGGGEFALQRHATAALLNASHPNISYAYTKAQVIAMVQGAYANGNFEEVKDKFAVENEKGADLSTGGSTGGTDTGPGSDANEPPGVIAMVGQQVMFTYHVKNTSTVELANVTVIDDNETADPGDDFKPTPVLSGGFNVGDLDKDNRLDLKETWVYTATKVVTEGQHKNTGTATGIPVDANGNPVGGPVKDQDAAHWLGVTAEPKPGSLSGFVYVDFDDDGQIDFGENGIAGVKVTLTGPVTLTTTTDANGHYQFVDLFPGTYTITETQPANFVDGKDTLGSLGGNASVNDQFSQINLAAGASGINYNFGERPQQGSTLQPGRTATIGFWHNKNGQALINSLNGGPTATALANYLATNFPKLYGAQAGANNLTGKTNADVAALFVTFFSVKGQKLDAQVLGVALATYVTDSTYAGNVAAAYGFKVTNPGCGADTFNVGSSGAAFGVANGTTLTLRQILDAANNMAVGGVLYNGNKALRDLANVIFTAINEAGDIL